MTGSDRSPRPTRSAADIAESLGVAHADHHVFLCTASECDRDRTAWKVLRHELRRRRLHRRVVATEASCLGICREGPIAVVHPDNVWYRGMDERRILELVESHLIGRGRVADLLLAESHRSVGGPQRGPLGDQSPWGGRAGSPTIGPSAGPATPGDHQAP